MHARGCSVNNVLLFSSVPHDRIKYAALSFSRSLTPNSGTDSIQSSGMDSQGVSMSPDGCVFSNDSSQPGLRTNYHGDYKDSNLKPICTQDLLSWAFQVARGMEYLSHRKVCFVGANYCEFFVQCMCTLES